MSDLDLAPAMDAEDDLHADLAAAFAGSASEPVIETAPEPAPALEATAEAETAAAAAAARARDDKGRFAPKPAEPQAPAADAQRETQAEPPAPVAEAGDKVAPPPGWSIAAKTQFDKLPPEVKDAVVKREAEINKGFAQLTEYKDLKPFAEIARQRNEPLPAMVGRLVQAQQALDTNPIGSLLWLCQSYRVHPAHLLQAISGQQQAQGQQPGQPQAAPQNTPALSPDVIERMVAQRAQELVPRLVQQTQQEREVSTALKSFLSDPNNTYAENLRPQMAHFLESGQAETLQDAYDMACWATPAIRQELLIKQQAAAPRAAPPVHTPAQAASNARQAAKSVTGSPLPGASSAPDHSALSIEDSLRAGFRAARV